MILQNSCKIFHVKKFQRKYFFFSWFDGFLWDQLESRELEAPLKRPIKDDIDLSNFDEYPRDSDEPPDEISGWDAYF